MNEEMETLDELYGPMSLNRTVKSIGKGDYDAFDALIDCENILSGLVYHVNTNNKQMALDYIDVLSDLLNYAKQNV